VTAPTDAALSKTLGGEQAPYRQRN
jgi:hypothetical protein